MINNVVHEHHVAYAVDIHFLNNCYTNPIAIKFSTTESESAMNPASKLREICVTIKPLDPSSNITTDNDNVILIKYPDGFSMNAEYVKLCKVINDNIL